MPKNPEPINIIQKTGYLYPQEVLIRTLHLMPHARAQLNDQELLQGLRVGDNEVLRQVYKKYYQLVLKLVVNNNGTQEAAQDVYQETIIVLYENVRKPDFELNCQLQTYIYSVARRLWLKQLKKNGRTFLIKEEEEELLTDIDSDIQSHHNKEADIEKMNKSLEQLGEPCATLIKDFYVAQMSMDAIAEKFGYTNADNAKNQKYKCLQRLKRHFFNNVTTEQD